MATNPFLRLSTYILQIAPEGPPCRRLKVRVRIDNPSDLICVLMSSWTEASFNPGGVAAEGVLFEQQHAQAHEAVLPAKGNLNGEFSIPVSPTLLERVEKARGNNVAFGLRSRFLFAPVHQDGNRQVVGAPWETVLCPPEGQTLGREIQQSEWVGYLKVWQWREIELFEIPFDSGLESPQFQRAYALVRVAEGRLRNGDFSGVLQNCRQALEGLAKDAGAEGALDVGFEKLLADHILGEEKRRRTDALLRALNKLGHLARHEERPHEDIYRKDAVFVLRITLSAIQYLTSPAV